MYLGHSHGTSMTTHLHQLLSPKAIILQKLPLQGGCLLGAGEQNRERRSESQRSRD